MSQESMLRLPKNVWVLALSQALAMSAVPMMILVSGLLATEIAPSQKWATLPVALVIVGAATSTIWVAMTYKKLGRKTGGYIGLTIGLIASGIGYGAAMQGSFSLLLTCGYVLGISVAFGQQFRFAALESVSDPANYGPALSLLMVGGLLAAFLGPEIGVFGKDLIASPHGFAGSYVLMGGTTCLAVLVFSFFKNPPTQAEEGAGEVRPLKKIIFTRTFIVAAVTAAIGYGVMSFIMTATPITMYELCGYTLVNTKQVLQGHIMAMYIPSLFGGWLIKRFGAAKMMGAGALLYACVVGLGLLGQELVHFWGALLVLGVGWNFLFVGGTTLLPRSYSAPERFKAQAANDFVVFGSQAIASLSAGWFLFSFGWNAILLGCLPFLAVAFGLAIWQLRAK